MGSHTTWKNRLANANVDLFLFDYQAFCHFLLMQQRDGTPTSKSYRTIIFQFFKFHRISMTSGGSRNSQTGASTCNVGAQTYYLANFFYENCMKMKESGPGGGRVPGAPLRSANDHNLANTTVRQSFDHRYQFVSNVHKIFSRFQWQPYKQAKVVRRSETRSSPIIVITKYVSPQTKNKFSTKGFFSLSSPLSSSIVNRVLLCASLRDLT